MKTFDQLFDGFGLMADRAFGERSVALYSNAALRIADGSQVTAGGVMCSARTIVPEGVKAGEFDCSLKNYSGRRGRSQAGPGYDS